MKRQRHAPAIAPGLPGGLERLMTALPKYEGMKQGSVVPIEEAALEEANQQLTAAIAAEPKKKRKSNAKKGADIENRAKGLLEVAGFLVHRCIRTPVNRGGKWYSNSNDLFNVFDLAAVRADHPTRFIQVTVKGEARERMRKVAHVARQTHSSSLVEVWAWVAGVPGEQDAAARMFEVWLWDFAAGAFRRIVDGEASGVSYAPP